MVAANPKPTGQNIVISDETTNYRAKVTSDQALVVTPVAGGTPQDVNLTKVGGVAIIADDAVASATSTVPVGGIVGGASYTAGDRGTLRFNTDGSLSIAPTVAGTAATSVNGTITDGRSNTIGAFASLNYNLVKNASSTWDGMRGDSSGTWVSGIFNTTLPNLSDTNHSGVQVSGNGLVTPFSTLSSGADGLGNTNQTMTIGVGNSTSSASALRVWPYAFNGTAWDRVRFPSSTSRIVSSAASTNATSGKASTGWLFAITGYNSNAAVRYLKLYNKASAPTVGTDTPIMTIALVPSAGFAIDFPSPYYFATGIAYALTTGSSDGDTGAVGAADILGLNLAYS